MAEYICRETLIQELVKKGFYPAIVKSVVEKAPAADVAPVVHGRWNQEKSVTLNFEQRLENCGTQYRCSKCGRRAGYKQVRLYHFCPACGAKMDGGESNGKT